jgi:hypothetical protein
MSDRSRRGERQEVDPGDEGIDRGNEVCSRRRVEQCRIVAYAQPNIRTFSTAVTEIPLYQLEFGQCHRTLNARRDAGSVPHGRAPR